MTEHTSVAAPFGAELWKAIEEAAISAAREILSARRILDVDGPHGLGLTTVETGKEECSPSQTENGAKALVSRLLPVPLIYQPFVLSTRLIAAATDMHQPLNMKPAEDAAQAVAVREEEFLYDGQPDLQLPGLLTVKGRNTHTGGNWTDLTQVLDDLITAVTILDGKGYRGPYGLALAPALYNNLFRHYPGTDLLQIQHIERLCTRGVVKAAIAGGVLVAPDVGPIVLGQDLQVTYVNPGPAHYNFAVSESLALKIEAPDAICAITPGEGKAGSTASGR
jgi:uncharacterized linocin/CFP29 family protein